MRLNDLHRIIIKREKRSKARRNREAEEKRGAHGLEREVDIPLVRDREDEKRPEDRRHPAQPHHEGHQEVLIVIAP
ncbi:hypothetical protein SDC9_203682 [bioreactor metagenome]|uniref:Uncharacterized protein n=1 Tax=bioreactor metagenome TaxID=1076179 RepID=A0A645IX58_9ZZZZ